MAEAAAPENGNGWGESGGRTPPRQEESWEQPSAASRPPPDRRNEPGSENPGNNLHVAGLDRRTRESDLEEVFGKFGPLQKVQIMKDPHTRESRGFAFVTFESPEDAEAATAALNATTLDDRTITVEKARRGRARTPTPGQYRGPPKPGDDPRDRRFPPRGPPGRYDDYRDRDRGDRDRRGGGYGGYAEPMRGGPPRDDRRYDDRDRAPRRDRYDDRPPRDDRRGDDRRPPAGDYGRRDRDYDDRRRDDRGGRY